MTNLESDPLTRKLEELLLLPDDWNGQGAPAPSLDAIEMARAILTQEPPHGTMETQISADVDGGLALYFFGGNRMDDHGWRHQTGILVSNDGEACVYQKDRATNLPGTFEDVELSPSGIGCALMLIQSRLQGRTCDRGSDGHRHQADKSVSWAPAYGPTRDKWLETGG